MEPVKILFICSSLEPGKDGVGDYTRRLAAALNKKTNVAKIIAINDRRLENDVWQGSQCDEGSKSEVLRLSSSLPWNTRIQKAKQFADDFDPDWISLQYVPFGFHLKGLPFHLGKKLKRIAAHQPWHVMFHELSVNKDESFKFRIWSFLQVQIIKSLLKELKSPVINTNTELYKYRLKEMGFNSTVLPLFSNISKVKEEDSEAFKNIIPAFITGYRDAYIIGTLFGSFDFKRWDMRSLLDKFTYSFTRKRIVIVSIGRMSSGQASWDALKYDYPQVLFISLGQQSREFISYWLSGYTDFGILTTLPELAGKSGSYMAFKEHGIPVVCTKENASLQHFQIPVDKVLTVIDEEKNFELPGKYEPVSVLDNVVEQFINDLNGSTR